MQCSSFSLNIRRSGFSVSREIQRFKLSVPGSEIRERKRGVRADRPGVGRFNDAIDISSPVQGGGSEVGLRCIYLKWHDGSEGSGDGISPPCPQAEHLPGQRVQLLVRQSALLTCGGQGQR